jgi:hypothetical protein
MAIKTPAARAPAFIEKTWLRKRSAAMDARSGIVVDPSVTAAQVREMMLADGVRPGTMSSPARSSGCATRKSSRCSCSSGTPARYPKRYSPEVGSNTIDSACPEPHPRTAIHLR